MGREPPHRVQLHSWKEIAQYLGVTERTAQKWERQRGLPVHRLPGEKGRVIAWLDELDRWRSSVLDKPAWWVSVSFWRGFAFTSATVLLAVALGFALHLLLRARHGPPVRFVLEGRALRALDANGREAWRTLLEQPPAEGVSPSYWLSHRLAWFGDLNADGRTEFLYVHHPDAYYTLGDVLICYSHTGQVLWRYRNTRTVASPGERFAPPWLVAFVLPLPPLADGTRRVLVVTHHLSWYPAQVAVLSSEGRVLGEYWHSGHILFGEIAELDGDPQPEVLLAGISNSHRTSTLIALDPEDLHGASQEEAFPHYQLLARGGPCEKARLLFPRTCISRLFDPYSKPSGLFVHAGRVHFGTNERTGEQDCTTLYQFDMKLNLLSAEVNDAFLACHRELEVAGQLDHPFTEAELQALRQVRILRHWDTSRSAQEPPPAAGPATEEPGWQPAAGPQPPSRNRR